MKKLILILTILPALAFGALRSQHGLTRANAKQLLNNNAGQPLSRVRMGNLVDRQLGSALGKWSFAVQGGAVSTISLLDDDGQVLKLPSGAIITQCFIDVVTAMASGGGTGTIALTSNAAADLKAAVDADTLSGIVACIPVGTAATSIKLTAERTISVAIATEALTAGKFNLYISYISGE